MGDPRVEEAIASGRLPPRVTREELEMSQDVAGITALAEVHHQALRLRPDDGIALASLVVFIPFAALCIELINLGTGRSIAFVRFAIDDATWVRQQIFDSIAHLVYATALVLCRISGLAFYYRICALHKGFLVAIRIIFAVLVIDLGDAAEAKVQLACILLPGIAVVGISVSRIVFVIGFAYQTPDTFDFAFLRLLVVEVSEIGATLIALSIPGVKPMVDKFILRKDICSKFGGSRTVRTCSNRGSIGSQSSSLSILKGRSHSSVFDDDSTAQHGAAVCRGELNEDVKQEGIQVTVDIYVEGAQS
ncbi:integral membrane protein pth11 [Hirsutella rhossiliensis]|uniref:Integral membrane protein pth11 n=1 Tax=Hirsutella rhossiliensis TaxID=111463 RepID=A0A9P8SFB3_9HYPO|nr:integral membrane protein pth11 [Hirsutella rhossiliensis]KAH0959869.1 integral membrane protein pth11 [Hirsutella rhossiliensis]